MHYDDDGKLVQDVGEPEPASIPSRALPPPELADARPPEEEGLPTGKNTGLVMIARHTGPLTPYRPDNSQGRRLATSLDLRSPEGKLAAFRAISGQDFRADEVMGEWFPIADWLNVDAARVDPDTGELQHFVRTVLIGEDGTRFSCGSDWVLSSLIAIESFFGKAPWHPAMQMRFVQQKSRMGRTFTQLDVRQ